MVVVESALGFEVTGVHVLGCWKWRYWWLEDSGDGFHLATTDSGEAKTGVASACGAVVLFAMVRCCITGKCQGVAKVLRFSIALRRGKWLICQLYG